MNAREQTTSVSLSVFAGRLLIIVLIFGLALLMQLRGDAGYSERELLSLWALVVAGFSLTVIYGLLAAYAGGLGLPLVELAGDGLLISGLVYCTGGARSLFGFLYLVWIVHAAIRSGARAAIVTSASATLVFGLMVFGTAEGWLPVFDSSGVASPAELLRAMGTHTLAFVAVAMLAHRFAREVEVGQGELYELGEIHQRIVDNVSSGLLTVSQAQRITSFNREAERITGYSSKDVIGWPLGDLFPDLAASETLGAGAGPVREVAEDAGDGGLARGQIRFCNREQEELCLGFSLSTLSDEEGQPEGSVLIFQDLTRVLQLEEELRRSERLSAVGQLAAGLAHQIRNPLASLSGAIELLASDLPEVDPNSRRLMRIVQRETGRLDRLVSSFLSYAGPGPVQREQVVLNELLEELGQLLESGECPAARVYLELSPELCVFGNPDQLRQVFWNLVLNAVEAGGADNEIRVRGAHVAAEEADGSPMVEVEISDQGEGIPAEILERVFEPFFTTKPKGTGLGLAMVHRVVEAHGGQLLLKSRSGEGTSVRVRLPAAPL
ncbi:MAG: ATP-binding protein [Deltaproteobacteria bacterium]|nr:ATP-binding protein [Deltaproteobacteria bacterium]